MIKYLLIILILSLNIKSKVSSQIITISQSGRKIISNRKPIKDTIVIAAPIAKNEREPLIRPQNKIDFDSQPEVKQREFLAPPLTGKLYVTSYFGERYHPVLHKQTIHVGIDLRADYEIVNTIANGIIVKEGYDTRAGNYEIIEHGNGIESIYCHLSKFLLKTGEFVLAGGAIAVSGVSGTTTAPHLHFAIKAGGRYVDPLPLLKAILLLN